MSKKPTAASSGAVSPALRAAREFAQQHKASLTELQSENAGRELAELSRRISKKPLVLFFGRPNFSDNTKYLFLETLRSAPDYEVLWCTATKELAVELTAHGLPCLNFMADFPETMRRFLQASVAVFCENMNSSFGGNNMLAGALAGAQKIQLWHGVSVKHLDLMLVPYLDVFDRGFRNPIKLATRTDHFLSTSSQLDAFWVRAFGCTSLLRAGQPRNTVIVREPTALEMIGASLPPEQLAAMRNSNVRRVLVAPTWQRAKPLFISTAAFYERLAAWAEREQAVAFVKLHPFLSAAERPRDVPGRLYFLDAGVDIYPWMSRFDAMITDYSSIMFDFLFTERPIFTFDSRTQVSCGFEPDWSLIPNIPFRYSFDAHSFERVLDDNIVRHPLRDSQRQLRDQLFETNPVDASSQLIRVIAECNATALYRPVDVISDDDGAGHELAPLALTMSA